MELLQEEGADPLRRRVGELIGWARVENRRARLAPGRSPQPEPRDLAQPHRALLVGGTACDGRAPGERLGQEDQLALGEGAVALQAVRVEPAVAVQPHRDAARGGGAGPPARPGRGRARRRDPRAGGSGRGARLPAARRARRAKRGGTSPGRDTFMSSARSVSPSAAARKASASSRQRPGARRGAERREIEGELDVAPGRLQEDLVGGRLARHEPVHAQRPVDEEARRWLEVHGGGDARLSACTRAARAGRSTAAESWVAWRLP